MPRRSRESSRAPRERRSRSSTSSSPTPDRARRSCGSRPAGCATPTCTTARAASTTSSRSCSGTRRPASSRRSARASPTWRPGDFVILNWRAVCGQCRACAKGKPWYCFNTAQRHAEDDAHRRHRALAGARHRRVHREDARRRRPVHQGRPRGRPRRGRPARLRRHGRLRRGRQHRRRQPRRLASPSSAAAASATRPIAGAVVAGATTIIAVDVDDRKLEWARGFGATHTVNSKEQDPVEAIRGPHRRLRRRRRHRGGRAARDLRAGVLRPRPGRHRRPRRRAHPRPAGDAAADRDLRPRRRAEVQLVRRLPALAGLPDARRPLPAGPFRPRRVRLRDDRHRATSRPRSRRCTAARSCARS